MKTSDLSTSRLRVGSDELVIQVPSDATGDALMAIEVHLPPGGGPPMLHRHRPEEVYRVERGDLAVYLEDEEGAVCRRLAGPGDTVHIPGGRAHTVRNESEADVVAYVVFAPGGEMERFLHAAAELAADGPPRPEDVLAVAERHGIEMTGPVPA